MSNPFSTSKLTKIQMPTPFLAVDLEGMEANLDRMAAYFAARPARLRPHFKTHKCPVIAQMQMERGAIGLTCAKLGEAEVLVEAGIPSILIANQVVDPTKIARLAELASKTQIILAIDDPDNARQLSEAAQRTGSIIHILVEVDVGMQRCGVQPGEEAVSLAYLIAGLPGLHFAGVLGYEGQAVLIADPDQRRKRATLAMSALVHTAELIRQSGLEVEIVSAGGTGTYDITGNYPGVTEVEAGSYVFMDTKYQQTGVPFQQALTLMATVISVPTPGRAIIDAGMKVLTTENGLPSVLAPAGVRLVALHEEHGILEVDPAQAKLRSGHRVEIIPSHVCTTINLHDQFYIIRDNLVEDIWPITARGKSQ